MTTDNTKTNENQNNPLGYENEAHLLTTFAIPCIISMLVTALYNIVDQIFIGHGVGMLGNAATNIAFPLSTACTAISLLLGIGSATSFSLKLGAGDEKKSAEAAGNGICLMAIFGVALFLVTTIFLTPMLKAFGATDKVLPFAQEYTRITAIGFPFLIANTGMSKLIMADGSPRYSMISMLTGAIINTILDPILIFGLDMGMRGAALATITGQIISFAISLRYMFHFKTIHLTRESFVMRGEPCGNIFRFGASACFNQIAMAIVQVVMNNTLSRYGARSVYGGDIPLACSGIISKVNMIFMAIVIGISQGTQLQLWCRKVQEGEKDLSSGAGSSIGSVGGGICSIPDIPQTDHQRIWRGKRAVLPVFREILQDIYVSYHRKWNPAGDIKLLQLYRKGETWCVHVTHKTDTISASSHHHVPYIHGNRWCHVCGTDSGRNNCDCLRCVYGEGT